MASAVFVLTAGGGAVAAGTGTDRLLAWGVNNAGELGNGGAIDSALPIKVHLPKGTKVVAMSAGGEHSLALTATGHVLAWGLNFDGELGHGGHMGPEYCGFDPCSPTPIRVKLPKGIKVTAVSAGEFGSLALTSTGQVYAWGWNGEGLLGEGMYRGPRRCGSSSPCSPTPVRVHLPSGTRVTAVSAGSRDDVALTSTGQVLAWGDNFAGELGVGTFTGPDSCNGLPCSTTPVIVHLPTGTNATAVAAGGDQNLAVTSTGQVLAWGGNLAGELGIGSIPPSARDLPVKVHLPAGTRVVSVRAGSVFGTGSDSLALTSTGQVLAWGSNVFGQAGQPPLKGDPYPAIATPISVPLPQGTKVVGIAAGAFTNLALTSRQTLLAWGYNGGGQLGDGSFHGPDHCFWGKCSPTPVKVKLPKGDKATAVGPGPGDHSLVLVHRT